MAITSQPALNTYDDPVQNLSAEQIAQKATEVTQRLSTTPTINSNTLKPAKPLKLPPQQPQTLAGSTTAYIQSQNNTVKTEAQNALDLQRKELDRNKNDIASLIQDLGHPTADKNAEYEAQGVNAAKKQVDEYTSQLEAEQVANAHAVTALQKNKGGLFAGATEQEINRINQDSLTKQADLAVLQNAALRKYSTSAEIADRAVQAKLEPLKAKLDALQFFYTENKADFNKADDRAYNELIKKQDREYETEKSRLEANNTILKEAIGTGAPSNIISNIQRLINEGASEADIAMAAGQYSSLGRQTYESNRSFNAQNGWKLQNTTDANGNTVSSWVNESTRQIIPVGSQPSAAPSIASYYPDGSTGPGTGNLIGQCGAFINATVDLPTPNDTVGSTLAQKQATVKNYGIDGATYQQQGARVGDVLFFNIGSAGHVAAVNTVNPDGTVTVSESNLNLDGKVSNNRIVDLSNPTIIGAVRGTFKNGIQTSQPEPTSNIKLTNDQKQRLAIEGMTPQDISELTAYIGKNGIQKALSDLPLSDNEKKAITETFLGSAEANRLNEIKLDNSWVEQKFPYETIISAGASALSRSGFLWHKGVSEKEKYEKGRELLLKAGNDLRIQGEKDDNLVSKIYEKFKKK